LLFGYIDGMQIVPANEIPSEVTSVPLGEAMKAYQIAQQMIDLCQKEEGVGLSAVQVGIPWKLFVAQMENDPARYDIFANCDYAPMSLDRVSSVEGCLSLRDPRGKLLVYKLPRYQTVRVSGKKLVARDTAVFEPFDQSFVGLRSIIFQHEIDHQNGILISDPSRKSVRLDFYK
jgi:peptide deformylase